MCFPFASGGLQQSVDFDQDDPNVMIICVQDTAYKLMARNRSDVELWVNTLQKCQDATGGESELV